MDIDQRKIILHISNISLDVSGVDVWRHFAEIGIIKIFKLYDDGEADILYFDNMDVEKAICKYNLQTFRGKVLILSEGERLWVTYVFIFIMLQIIYKDTFDVPMNHVTIMPVNSY